MLNYSRSYSPVPPPCPSPQPSPKPLPTPPVYARRPSLTPSSSSREHLPPKLKMRQNAAASSESLVFSLRDAVVAGSPSRRRFSEHARLRETNFSDSTLYRRPWTAEVDRSFVSLPSPVTASPFDRKHRRSDSITHQSDVSFPPSSPPSRSLARKRTRSPTGGPVTMLSEAPPPVPPLPPLPAKREGRSSSLFSKKLPCIRIPELGLGLDEKLRSPLSPLLSSAQFGRRESRSKTRESEGTSFLHMDPKRRAKRRPTRSSLDESDPSSNYTSIRPMHSLPDIKTAQRRRNSSFSSKIFRFGTQQLVH